MKFYRIICITILLCSLTACSSISFNTTTTGTTLGGVLTTTTTTTTISTGTATSTTVTVSASTTETSIASTLTTTTTNSATTSTLNITYLLSAEAEAAWIMSAQLANGAVLIHPNGTGVTPYYSNLALQAVLLATREYDSAVKDYLIWYLENLNDPDNLGVSGTIYDYHWDGAVLTSRDDYDSSDSYAATFLSLLNEYYQQTGDRTFIEDNLAAIKLVASAIASTEQADGLTYALINYHVKYLMDNTEVWRGYVDYADLLGAIGDSDSAIYTAKAAQIAAAIEDQMWHSTGEEYFYYAGDTAVDWLVFYPDATANLWPTIFGLSINAERNSLLLQKFLTNQPAWLTCEANEFPWAAIALGAAKGSEDSTVLAYDQYLQQKFLADQHYPWNINDAGWRIRYLLELSR